MEHDDDEIDTSEWVECCVCDDLVDPDDYSNHHGPHGEVCCDPCWERGPY